MMNISTWQGAFLNIYLLNHNSLSRETWPLIDINKGNNFQEFFEQFGGLGLSSRSFLIYNLLQLLNNQLCQDSSLGSSFFEKVYKGRLKMVNVNY